MENKIMENIKAVFDGVAAVANTQQVVGEPGCKVKPVACLIIQNGFTKLISISDQDPISKALDIIPDMVDKLTKRGAHDPEVNEAIEEIKDSYDV